MRHQLKCTVCGVTCWAKGWDEPDTNSAGADENDPLEDACEHILAGGDWEIIDTSTDDYDED